MLGTWRQNKLQLTTSEGIQRPAQNLSFAARRWFKPELLCKLDTGKYQSCTRSIMATITSMDVKYSVLPFVRDPRVFGQR